MRRTGGPATPTSLRKLINDLVESAVAKMETILNNLKASQSPDELVAIYDNWSSNYDEMMVVQHQYNAPLILVDELVRLVPENRREKVRVLDVGAGTGWIGCLLSKKGFTNMDALEPSEGMMKRLRATGVYTLKFQEFIGFGQSSIPHDTYDIVLSVGAMYDNHIPLSGMDDMARFAKPGGLVIILMNHTDLENLSKVESHMDQLEQRGSWRKESSEIVQNYFLGKEGIVFINRVL